MKSKSIINKKSKSKLAGKIYGAKGDMMPSCGNICSCACFCNCACWVTGISDNKFVIAQVK
jgi:hypothetical protein